MQWHGYIILNLLGLMAAFVLENTINAIVLTLLVFNEYNKDRIPISTAMSFKRKAVNIPMLWI